MTNSFKGWTFYSSTFDMDTGLLVREVEELPPDIDAGAYYWHVDGLTVSYLESLDLSSLSDRQRYSLSKKVGEEWRKTFGKKSSGEYYSLSYLRSDKAFSPVPETVDIKISDWCSHGCDYCYMDSTKKGEHAPKELLVKVFEGLDTPPYQIAFGGGEPTAHPDFPWFLQYTREKGTVPNYTTAGFILRQDVIDATNKYCGGVALTYHAFKGPEYFKGIYDKWKSALDPRVQLNVHVLFDDDVVKSLKDLIRVGLRNLNVVLLAYYPEVGRSSMQGLPSKKTYTTDFPGMFDEMGRAGYRLAFSEGLLPYFLSHSFPQVDVRFATQQEGLFSCYVDDKGRVSHSSFSPPEKDYPTIYDTPFQELWKSLSSYYYGPHLFSPCYKCKHKSRCHVPHDTHFMACAYAPHNSDGLGKSKRKLPTVG